MDTLKRKIEMHCHTSETSPCGSIPAAEAVREYARIGYGAIVVTDHFNRYVLEGFPGSPREKVDRYLLGYDRACEEGAKAGLAVLLGAESCLAGGPEDFLLYGIGRDFLYEYPRLYAMTQAEVYRACREYGALLFQAHPCRPGLSPRDPSLLDGVEAYNGNVRHQNHNAQAAAFARRHRLLLSSGSDFHEYEDLGRGGLLLPCPVSSNAELRAALRNGGYALIEDGQPAGETPPARPQ